MEDINVDLANYASVQIFVKRLKRLNVESMTFDTSCNEMDINGFLDVVANPPRDIGVYEDINTLLIERKADKVYFNTVEFKIRTKGEEDYGNGTGGIIEAIKEEEEFDLVDFLEKTCGLKAGDSPKVEAEKVTGGLVEIYNSMAGITDKEELRAKETVFEEVMGSISPEAKRFILQDKLKLKQISSIIKSIIMSFSDEEIVEIFVNRVQLLGIFDAEDMLLNLTPERLDGILPQIKEKLKMADIEDENISGLEAKLKLKISEKGQKTAGVSDKEGKKSEGSAVKGSTSDISAFINEFAGKSDREYGADNISRFFSSVCLLEKEDNNKAEKISEGFENFVKEFINQFGKDNLLQETAKIRKTFKQVPNKLRKEIFVRIIKSKSPLKIPMVKVLLPVMDEESIVFFITTLIEEDERETLEGFLFSLDKKKISVIKKLAKEALSKLGIDESGFSKLWKSLTSPPKNFRRSGGVSRRAYGRLENKLKASIDLSDIKTLMETFYKGLASQSVEVKLNALSNMEALSEQLFKGEKAAVIRRIVDDLIDYARKEKNKEVYINYIGLLSQIGQRSLIIGYDFLVSSLISFFAGEVNNVAKAKIIIPHLAEFKTKEAVNVLLSLLWEKDLRKIVVEKVEDFGVESIPYLMDLLKDSEDREVRFSLLKIIQGIGSGALEVVRKYLGDKRWYVRRNAVLILGNIGNEEVLEDIYALKDDHEQVQIEIIRNLRHMLKDKSESYLLYFLDSNYPEVQKYAVSVLAPMVTEEGVTALNKRLLINKFSKGDGVEIKKQICKILADKGSSQSVEALIQIIDAKKVFGIPEFPEDLRFEAVKAIAEIGGVRADDFLKTLNRDRSKQIRNFVSEVQ